MGAYQRDTGINLVNRFWTVDPLTQEGVLADPTTVVFTVLDPDGTETSYTFGVDVNVTNPSAGIFICTLTPPLPTGTYRYSCEGTGAVVARSEDYFDILPSGILNPAPPNVAVPGPCSSWINGDDVANVGPDDLGVGNDHFLLDDVAYQASSLLYDLTGRQFPGVCSETVRPCASTCACFGSSPSLGLGPWYWTSAWFGGVGSWSWRNECGDTCGCGGDSQVRLAGYPVREVIQVLIDGVALPEFDPPSGARNWRLDRRSTLWRMGTPASADGPYHENWWPVCQYLDLDDDQPGTFSVTYTWGADVPPLGRDAAAQLARELWKASKGQTCQLPSKTTKVVRQGVTMERIVPLAAMFREGSTGLPLVDAFIAQVNPGKMIRRPAVFSPDLEEYARRVGQVWS